MARKSRNHPVPRNACGSNLPERDIEKQEEAECRSFSAALYIRLSKEDSGKQNPDTIENQTALLEEYVKGQPDITVYRHYVDNGFSGTGFRRPAFENMMEDAKAGKVNCIIVKDLSRFGRNYLETGNYLEKVFPFLKLRFISVTDHLDTLMAESGKLRQPDGLEVPLKNIINEIYAKDISKKTSAAIDLRKHEGRYGGGVAPYGYRKSETEKGRYEVDREAAGTVRKIFEYRAQGYGYCTIAKILNEQGIMSPGAHRFAQHVVRDERMQGAVWKMDVIRSMLHDEVYLGSMVRGKTHMALHKGERRHHVPREDWIVVPETHEAIISRELYDKVQAVNAERAAAHRENMQTAKKQSVGENIFRGKLFCGDCGAAMALHGGGRGYREYYCPTYRRIGEAGCRKKHMGEMNLKKAVWKTLQVHMALLLDKQDSGGNSGADRKENDRLAEMGNVRRELLAQSAMLQKRIGDLYSDYKEGLLNVQEYFTLKGDYQIKLAECETLCREQETVINSIAAQNAGKTELEKTASKYAGCSELTKEMIDCLIERIEIFEKGRMQITFRYEDLIVSVTGKGETASAGRCIE